MEQAPPDALCFFVVFLYTLGLSGNLVWSSDEHLKQLSQAKAKAEANKKQKQKDLCIARATTRQADKACILKLPPMNLHQLCCRKTLSSWRPDVAAYFRRRSQTSRQRDHQKCGWCCILKRYHSSTILNFKSKRLSVCLSVCRSVCLSVATG